MKAGVAVQLKLAAELAEPVPDVTWIWYDHEEVGEDLNGLNRLLQEHPEELAADFAILGEPTIAGIEGGCNGNLRAEIRTFGKRAHSARSLDRRQRDPPRGPDPRPPRGLRAALGGGRRPRLPRGPERGHDPRRRRRQRDPRRVRRAGQPPLRPVPHARRRRSRHVRGGLRGLRGDGSSTSPRARAPGSTSRSRGRSSRRSAASRARSTAGPTSPASPASASLRSTTARATRCTAHTDDEYVPVDQIHAVEAGLRAWLTGA